MNERDFVYWLQGFVELTSLDSPTAEQWKMIKEHLQLVFLKVTPAHPTQAPIENWPQPHWSLETPLYKPVVTSTNGETQKFTATFLDATTRSC